MVAFRTDLENAQKAGQKEISSPDKTRAETADMMSAKIVEVFNRLRAKQKELIAEHDNDWREGTEAFLNLVKSELPVQTKLGDNAYILVGGSADEHWFVMPYPMTDSIDTDWGHLFEGNVDNKRGYRLEKPCKMKRSYIEDRRKSGMDWKKAVIGQEFMHFEKGITV